MKSFVVFYNNGVADGLSYPSGEDEKESNARTMKERLETHWSQIEVAKVLKGLVIHSRQEFTGSLCVSGSQEQIDQLKAFLEEKNLGTIVPNEVMFKGA